MDQSDDLTAPSGIRSVCDLGLRQAAELGPVESDGSFAPRPGDLVLFRRTDNWMSELIVNLDGYWSHSAIYVGDGQVVHSTASGVSRDPISAFRSDYQEGIGFARPRRTAERSLAAACWAEKLAEGDRTDEANRIGYSGRDLGVAFILLLRARLSGGREALPDIRDATDELVHSGYLLELALRSTCSGLAYLAYRDGAKAPLEIEPAPGLAVKDNRIVFADDAVSLYEGLTRPDAGDDEEELDREGLDWEGFKLRAKLIGQAAAGAFSCLADGDGADIEQAVSPADLWCSPDIETRRLLGSEHVAAARRFTSHCP